MAGPYRLLGAGSVKARLAPGGTLKGSDRMFNGLFILVLGIITTFFSLIDVLIMTAP
jgi:hypothetical protein